MKAANAMALIVVLMSLGSAAQSAPPATPPSSKTALMFRANHVALRVRDVEASVQWWKTVFGAREVRRSKVANIDPDIEIVFLHLADGFHIEIVGGGNPTEPGKPEDIAADYGQVGYKHIGFLVDDLDRVLDHLARHGVEPEYRVERRDYGVTIALIREPSGRYVELYAPINEMSEENQR